MLNAEDEAQLHALEDSLWRAETRYDRALMEQTFAADFTEIGRSGRAYEREEMFLEPDPEAVIDATLPLPGYSVRQIAPDVALATYISEVRYDDEVERGQRSSLWSRINGRWHLRFHQGTSC